MIKNKYKTMDPPPGIPIPNPRKTWKDFEGLPPLEKPQAGSFDRWKRMYDDQEYFYIRPRYSQTLNRRFYRKKRKQEPVISCGILCFLDNDIDKEKAKVLLIRRKDSLSYVEFIRGKYKPTDPMYIHSLIRRMTKEEITKILTKTFYELWTEMWSSKTISDHQYEYDKSSLRFEKCKEEVRKYIKKNYDKFLKIEPEWTFPKGRPLKSEKHIDCAFREFEEETGIKKERLKIISLETFTEIYTGTNGILYKNIYLIGKVNEPDIKIDPKNIQQMSEVSGIGWFTKEEALEKLNTLYPSREAVLEGAFRQFLMARK
jgi:ADP-ribose pyrophosphatase YjhB (NUDIX family)